MSQDSASGTREPQDQRPDPAEQTPAEETAAVPFFARRTQKLTVKSGLRAGASTGVKEFY
jgi:hypothetical protein